jgi:hypothetical protein
MKIYTNPLSPPCRLCVAVATFLEVPVEKVIIDVTAKEN